MPAPLATYRLQLHPGFDFDAAAAVAGYLADLGVTHAYLSPVLQAAPGSTHGYDVVDHSRPSADLGGPGAHARLCAALGAAGLGQVLDIVPNHMAIGGPENRWWRDVLENGPSSLWASHFDVSWDPPEEKLRNTVLMPILGDHYGRVLDRGEVVLAHERGEFTIRYPYLTTPPPPQAESAASPPTRDPSIHVLPVALRTLAGLLASAAARAGSDDLAFIATALRRLPVATRTDRPGMVERHRDTAVLRRQLVWLLDNGGPRVAAAIDAEVAGVNGNVEALHSLLEDQNYRIAHWRTAGRELGYRRFFDINTLVGLRMEDPEVFDETHELVLRWVREGVVDGLRVDHPDGLRDPEGYLERLAAGTGGVGATWLVAEKVLEHGESLPSSWPVAGTTGYDRLAAVNGLFVDPAGEAPLTAAYGALTGSPTSWDEVVLEAKALAVREILAADVSRLVALLVEVCESRRHQRDRTRHELAEAVRELLVSCPVYRSYVRADVTPPVVRPADVASVEAAVAGVLDRRHDIDPDLLGFLADLLLVRLPDAGPLDREFAMRFQQLSGPAMAKGVEDTAFYRFTRLLALNEVGCDPSVFGTSVASFHATNARVQDEWPATMTTLSTHDTKRSADVRARLALLSEVPEAWAAACGRWVEASGKLWPGDDPDPATQYLLFQTLVGAWPIDAERAVAFLAKATKEAKVRTTWTEPDADFDLARDAWVEAVLGDATLVDEVEAFVRPLAAYGWVNGLAQHLLALTVPGVPDVYQGNELVDLSLVDPDNRRPVDFALRRALLAELDALEPETLLARAEEGLPKLRVTRDALHLRRRRPSAFGPGWAGAYVPLAAAGAASDHVVAFTRGGSVAVVVPRLVLGLAGGAALPGPSADVPSPAGLNPLAGVWADTGVALPAGDWVDLVTGARWPGGELAVADVLARFPVGLLERLDG